MIQGKYFSWEDLNVVFPYGRSWSLQEASWDDEKGIEAIYGIGSKPIAYARDNWKGSGKVTMLTEEYLLLIDYANAQGSKSGIYGIKPFDIILNFANDDESPHTIVLSQVVFTKKSRKASQGDKKLTVDLDIEILGDIKETGASGVMVSSAGL